MIRLHDIAHSRAGDKGNTSNISVIAYDAEGWEIIQQHLSIEVVKEAFALSGTSTAGLFFTFL